MLMLPLILISAAIIIRCSGISSVSSRSGAEVNNQLTEKMKEYVQKYNSTAAASYAANATHICASGSVGYAQIPGHLPIFDGNGRIHMGSNTKSMTSALLASLLEKGAIRGQTNGWNTQLKDIFPEYAANSQFANVSLAALAAHFSGLDNVPENFWEFDDPSQPIFQQREAVTKAAFVSTPVNEPNTSFFYSNWGYIILGHVMEVSLNQTWEQIFIDNFLKPLQMYDQSVPYPFGAPNDTNSNWGHIPISADIPHYPCDPNHPPKFMTAETPTFKCDNPPYLGPAGTYSGGILATANYYRWLIRCINGEETQSQFPLSQSGCKELTTPYGPVDPSTQYGYGWGILEVSFNGEKVTVLNHAGSNNYNYVDVDVFPSLGKIYWAGTNSGFDSDKTMVQSILGSLPFYDFIDC